jgi:hypothetical protein
MKSLVSSRELFVNNRELAHIHVKFAPIRLSD